MTLDEIKDLIEFIRQHELTEFELERDGLKLRVKSGTPLTHVIAPPPSPSPMEMGAAGPMTPPSAGVAGSGTSTSTSASEEEESVDAGTELAIVKSPIVGTFYRAPEAAAPSFVEIGSSVKKGQVLCIIEAMKLMNEIDSEYDGEIVSIYVESGQPVQYGERLFAIRLKGGPS